MEAVRAGAERDAAVAQARAEAGQHVRAAEADRDQVRQAAADAEATARQAQQQTARAQAAARAAGIRRCGRMRPGSTGGMDIYRWDGRLASRP